MAISEGLSVNQWLVNQIEGIVKANKEYISEMEQRKLNGYEVWVTQGQGGMPVEKFGTLEEALAYAEKGIKNKEGSFAVKYPTGEWYEWNNWLYMH